MMVAALGALAAAFASTMCIGTSAGAQSDVGERVTGILCNRGDNSERNLRVVIGGECNTKGGVQPVVAAKVAVTADDGAKVGDAVSDVTGKFALALPGPGNYRSELDKASLAEGVKLTDENQTGVSFEVRPNQERVLIYTFGREVRVVQSKWSTLPALLVEGLKLGLIIAMSAIGLSLIYGTTQLTNFAHGEMVTFGAIAAWFFNQKLHIQLVPATIIAMVLGAGLGWALERRIWRPLRGRKTGLFPMMIVSFGLSIFALNLFQYLIGVQPRPYADYFAQTSGFNLGSAFVPQKTVYVIVLSTLVLGGVGLFLKRARFGKAMRAVSDNPALASSSGIDTDRVILLVWVAGAALAALGGVLYSVGEQVSINQGGNLLLLMFAGITLGGLGTAYGAAVGSVVLGLMVQLSTLWIPTSVKNVGALVLLVLILLVRPQGIFGRAERMG